MISKNKPSHALLQPPARIILVVSIALVALVAWVGQGCRVYSFRDVSIPDSIKTIKVNFIENKARYVNPQLSPRLTDRLRQKIVSQTKLSQVNGDNADWEITAEIREYSFSTSAISGQREAGNRLTVGIHVEIINHRKDNEITPHDISRNFEFSATQSIQQAEAALADEMTRSLTDDIFNRLFSDW